jgi:hypothetical protein
MDFASIDAGFRRAAYFFFAGMLIYLVSWTPILWRITWGIINYPDEMPNPVWIGTLGILIFYETFILAQCSSISTRFRMILKAQPAMAENAESSNLSYFYSTSSFRSRVLVLFFFTVSYPTWQALAVVAAGVSIDLITAVLYSVPYFRKEWFDGMPEKQDRAEPWATMCFLVVTWALVTALTLIWERRHYSNKSKAGTTKDSGWGPQRGSGSLEAIIEMKDSRNAKTLHKSYDAHAPNASQEDATLLRESNVNKTAYSRAKELIQRQTAHLDSSMGLFLAFVIYVGIGFGVFYLWGVAVMNNIADISSSTLIGILVVVSLLLVYAMYNTGKWRTRRPEHYEDVLIKTSLAASIPEQIKQYRQYHLVAAVFHFALVCFAFFIGLANKNENVDWWQDYIGMNTEAHFTRTNWETVSSASDNKSTLDGLNKYGKFDKTVIEYCASNESLAVYYVALSMTWSALSMTHHIISSIRLKHYEVRFGLSELPWKIYLVILLIASFVMNMPTYASFGLSVTAVAIHVATLKVVILVLYIGIFGPYDLFPRDDANLPPENSIAQLEYRAFEAVQDTSISKWCEYTFSATLMHVVVLSLADTRTALELFVASACLAASMLLANMCDAELNKMEVGNDSIKASAITLGQRIGLEKSFIFLSFFAKGVLTAALTIPWVWMDRAEWHIMLNPCT